MNLKEEILRIKNITNFLSNKNNHILLEGRYEDLLKQYPDFEDEINFFMENDPSPTKKYYPWMVKTYVNNDLDYQDKYDLISKIDYFDKNIHKFEKKDIYQYTYEEFTNKYEEALTKISKREIISSGIEKLYEDDKYLLIRPKNKEASCKYGSNTKWCIASNTNNYFDSYSLDNLFFFIIDKHRQPIEGKKKSPNYFKIAIQYEPNTPNWTRKTHFLHSSKNGEITFWNAIDDAVTKNTVTKYIDKNILKTFIDLIKEYTYNLYLNFYDSQLKKKEEFDIKELENTKKEVTNKRRAYTTSSNNYSRNKDVRFVEETLQLYANMVDYFKRMGIKGKTLDEFLDFKGTKEKFYEAQKNKDKVKEILDLKYKELVDIEEKYQELLNKREEISSTINFRGI